jgi:hypothetical protein
MQKKQMVTMCPSLIDSHHQNVVNNPLWICLPLLSAHQSEDGMQLS